METLPASTRARIVRADRDNCSRAASTETVSVRMIHFRGEVESVSLRPKLCRLDMPTQRLAAITIYSVANDTPAFTAHEVDRGDYGQLTDMGPNPVLVDIGANVGLTSISFALANPTARVFSYEPNPSTFAMLQRNIESNGLSGRVRAHNAGLSGDGRHMHMPRCVVLATHGSQMASTQWRGTTSANGCFSKACKAKAREMERCLGTDARMVSIPTRTLESVLATLKAEHGIARVDLMKIDCEGCEYELLPRLPMDGSVRQLAGECHPIRGVTLKQRGACAATLNARGHRASAANRGAQKSSASRGQSSSSVSLTAAVPAICGAMALWAAFGFFWLKHRTDRGKHTPAH